MAFEIDFITLGDASKQLDVPSPTLRLWSEKLEEYNVHYLKRNNRNERIYYESDVEIFQYMRDLKHEFGRKTTNRDIAGVIAEKGKEGLFELRTEDDAPLPKSSNRVADLLGQEDIQQLMNSDRVKQFIGIVIAENSKAMREELIDDIKETVREEVRAELFNNKEELEKALETINSKQDENRKSLEIVISESRADRQKREEEIKKGFFSKLFNK